MNSEPEPASDIQCEPAVAGSSQDAEPLREPLPPPRAPRWLLAVFTALALAILLVGRAYYLAYERHYRGQVERQLETIADLKVSELAHWREERLGDGAVFLDNAAFARLVRLNLDPASADGARGRLLTWLSQVRAASRYDRVLLLDAKGSLIASAPDQPEPLAEHVMRDVAEALASRQVQLVDFHRDGPGQSIYLAVVVPVIDTQEPRQPLGALVLRIDPAQYLYPLIQRWPTPSSSAETLIVRRDGDHALFLNALRFHPSSALELRAPLANRRLPAARAVLGEQGIVEGVDYRGVLVLAALRQVAGAPWALVARMDLDEVNQPLRERALELAALLAALLLATLAVLGLAWRRSDLRFYRERWTLAQALRDSAAEVSARNDELTRFTYAVSHDLKSPLVTIQTFLGYLEQDLATREAARIERDLGFIRSAAAKMSRLLDELLELSRVGRKQNPVEEVALRAVVDEAQVLVAGRLADKGVQVEVRDQDVVLRGDRPRLIEIFQNLVDNAAKFTGTQAAPRVVIGADEGDGEIVLYVRDNGAGIDPRHRHKLFGLFEKLDPASEGTGMGLALVRRIVQVHGGRIWVESAGPGQGACFRLTLRGTRRAPPKDTP